jgi:hypothetical protein
MSKVIIIHPQDKSTEFLKEIVRAFNAGEGIVLIEPDLKYDATALKKQLDESCAEGDIILFLGHGRSDGLYGAPNEKGEKTILLSRDQARAILEKRNAVLFACDSNALLKRIGDGVTRFVGFGNMPTDWDEIHAERDIGDYKYLSKLTNESLEKFKAILVSMIISTRTCFFDGWNFSRAMYLTLRMELNKAMLKVAADTNINIDERTELFKIIQTAKSEITYKD